MTSNEKREKIIELASALAVLLGKPWTYTRPTDADIWQTWIDGENGARIYVNLTGGSYENPDRVNISGYLNIGRNRQYVTVYEKSESGGWDRATVPSITVALSRGPEAIAKEIQRRFLPEYLRIFALALEQVKKNNQFNSDVQTNLRKLAAVVGTRVPNDDEHSSEVRSSISFNAGEVYGTITASDGTARIELRCLTIKQAEQILKIVAKK